MVPTWRLRYTFLMFRWFRRHVRTLSVVSATAFAGLWLTAACASVSVCDTPCADHAMSMQSNVPCEQMTAACDTPPLTTLSSMPTFDIPFTPVIIETVSAIAFMPDTASIALVDWHAKYPSPIPLYLTHLALLF
jgi:hypothetical protein